MCQAGFFEKYQIYFYAFISQTRAAKANRTLLLDLEGFWFFKAKNIKK